MWKCGLLPSLLEEFITIICHLQSENELLQVSVTWFISWWYLEWRQQDRARQAELKKGDKWRERRDVATLGWVRNRVCVWARSFKPGFSKTITLFVFLWHGSWWRLIKWLCGTCENRKIAKQWGSVQPSMHIPEPWLCSLLGLWPQPWSLTALWRRGRQSLRTFKTHCFCSQVKCTLWRMMEREAIKGLDESLPRLGVGVTVFVCIHSDMSLNTWTGEKEVNTILKTVKRDTIRANYSFFIASIALTTCVFSQRHALTPSKTLIARGVESRSWG